jgi:hypothetical protein
MWVAMVAQFLGGLYGDQDDDDGRRLGRARDFVGRYEEGAPWEGISPAEAYHHHRSVAGRLSAQEYEEAAAEAFARLTPPDRAQLADTMRQHGHVRVDGARDDPRQLARGLALPATELERVRPGRPVSMPAAGTT